MPNFDGTGPVGNVAGRGLGTCARGRVGCGFRGGRGCGNFAGMSLEERQKVLEQELAAVREAQKNSSSEQ